MYEVINDARYRCQNKISQLLLKFQNFIGNILHASVYSVILLSIFNFRLSSTAVLNTPVRSTLLSLCMVTNDTLIVER